MPKNKFRGMHSKKLGRSRKKVRMDKHDNQRTTSSMNDSLILHDIDENNANCHSLSLDAPKNQSVGFNSSCDSLEDNEDTLSDSLSEINHASVNINEEFTSIYQHTAPNIS